MGRKGAAAKDRPRVVRALLAVEMARPESDPYGVAVGGEEEAWLYREDMRETWQATPDALEFLRSIAPPPVRPTRRRGKARRSQDRATAVKSRVA